MLRVALLLLAVFALGCSDRGTPLPTATQPITPEADSPSSALHVLEWSWNHRDVAPYSSLLTDDFAFQCGTRDPAGNRDGSWTREDELISLGNLFRKATSLTLTLDRNFRPVSDPRPGKDSRWHKTIRTTMIVSLLDADQFRIDVTGNALFYLVRGDSALIPQDLLDKGVGPDSTLWFLQR